MDKIRVAIIDDGVASCQLRTSETFTVLHDLRILKENINLDYGYHSLMCMAILNKYIRNSDYYWMNIRIIDRTTGLSSRDQLIKALELCLENNIKVIHLSIGTTVFSDFMYIKKIVDQLVEKGTIIVAALSNDNKYTCPACFENVIGVKTSHKLIDDKLIYVENSLEKIEFLASSCHLVKLFKQYTYSAYSNSFAAPVVTAKVLNTLNDQRNVDVTKMIEILKSESEKIPFELHNNGTDISVPVIGIYKSDKKISEELAESIYRDFINDGYNAFLSDVFQNNKFSLEKEKNISELNFHINFSSYDIVIAVITDSIISDVPILFDIIITDENFHNTVSGLCEEVIINNDVQEIYDEILLKFNK